MGMSSVRIHLPPLVPGTFSLTLALSQPIPTCQIPRDRVLSARWIQFDRLRQLSTAPTTTIERRMPKQVLCGNCEKSGNAGIWADLFDR